MLLSLALQLIPSPHLATCHSESGTALQVLVEGANPKDASQAMGRTTHNKLVYFPCPGPPQRLRGELVHVHAHTVRAFTILGDIVP